MKKGLLFLFCMVGLLQLVFAQPPGYWGRRNILRYDLFFMPSNFRKPDGLQFNSSYVFAYERVISRRTVMGGNFMMIRFPGQAALAASNRHLVRGLGFHSKVYPFLRRGWLAPIGPYVRYGFNFCYSSSRRQSHVLMDYQIGFGYSEIFLGRILVDFGGRFALADLMHTVAGGVRSTSADVYFAAEDITQTEFFKMHFGLGFIFGKPRKER